MHSIISLKSSVARNFTTFFSGCSGIKIRIHLITFIFLSLQSFSHAQSELPELNRKIVQYVQSVMGTQVNRGECWDLAYEALQRNNARWDGKFVFGKKYNPETEDILPGDVIQFFGVTVRYTRNDTIFTETMNQHTAIVYRIIDQHRKIIEIAHQNTDFSGRTVGLSVFDIHTVIKGKYYFYRPQPL